MFGLSLGHLIILLVVLLIFGGRRLPELGSALGKGLRSFRKGLEGIEDLTEQEPQAKNDKPKEPDDIISGSDDSKSSKV